MTERRQKIRGSTLELDQAVGLEGLLAYDTEAHNLRVYDGVVLGGYKILNESQIADLYTMPDRLTEAGDSVIGLSANSANKNGWWRTDATTTDLPVAAIGVIEVAHSQGGQLAQVWTRASNGFKYHRNFDGNVTWTAWQRLVDVNYLTTDATAIAYDSARLGSQLPAYYTNIVARLGYTPVNKAGDGITGALTIGTTLGVTGATTLSSTLTVTGSVALNGGVAVISGATPVLKLNDTTSGSDDFFLSVDADVFYILTDRDDNGVDDTPNPLELRNATSSGYLYASRIITQALTGPGSGLDADTLDGTELSAINASIALKANIASPAFTGTPTAPTGAATLDNTQIATTAWVKDVVIGQGQTWQDVTASRSTGTSYQNTTGRPIGVRLQVSVGSGNGELQVSTDNSTWVVVGAVVPDTNGAVRLDSGFTIVPAGHYYRWTVTAFGKWMELR